MQSGQVLRFKYSGLLQSAFVNFTCTEDDIKTIACEARVQLPILKKTYVVSSDYTPGTWDWIAHIPLHEAHASAEKVSNSDNLRQQNVLDPVTFFMKIHEGEWNEPTVKMLISHKIVTLEVHKIPKGYQIKRPEKNQQLIVCKDDQGISALEIPIPVLGTLSLKRL
jgi:hypothetical protein